MGEMGDVVVNVESDILTDPLSRFGLHCDPFDPASSEPAFYWGAGRGQLVEQVAHFGQFGVGVLVLEAPRGVGSEILMQQVESQLEASCCTIDADTLQESAELFRRLLEHLEPGQAVDSLGVNQVLAELRHMLSHGLQGGPVMLAVRHADALDDSVVKGLAALVASLPDTQGLNFKVLLWTEMLASSRYESLELGSGLFNSVSIRALDETETREYVECLMGAAGWQGEPVFSEADYATLWRQSRGIPEKINAFARALLLTAVPESEVESKRRVAVTAVPQFHSHKTSLI